MRKLSFFIGLRMMIVLPRKFLPLLKISKPGIMMFLDVFLGEKNYLGSKAFKIPYLEDIIVFLWNLGKELLEELNKILSQKEYFGSEI